MLEDLLQDLINTASSGIVVLAKLIGWFFVAVGLIVLAPIWLPLWLLGFIASVSRGGYPLDNDASLGG